MRFSRVVIFLAIVSTLILTATAAYYSQRYQAIKQASIIEIAQSGLNQLTYSEREFANSQEQLFSVVDLLGDGQLTADFALDPSKHNKNQLKSMFVSVLKSQKWYDHIRFVDNQGIEKLRVDYYPHTHSAQSMEDRHDHSQSGFFRYAQTLAADDIGIWSSQHALGPDVDLTLPSIRVITPVSVLDKRYGYIMVSVDPWNLANRLNYVLNNELRPHLVSEQGIYLAASGRNYLHAPGQGSLRGESLAQRFTLSWDEIKQMQNGYTEEKGHLLIFTTFDLSADQKLHLVITLSPEQLEQRLQRDVDDLVKQGIFVFLLLLVFILPTFSMALHYHRRNIESKLARAALEGMSAVMISDNTNRVIKVNQQFKTITGLSSDAVLGKNALKVMFNQHGMTFIVRIMERIEQEKLWQGEVEFVTPEQRHLTTIMRIQAISEAGRISYYITSLVDISEHKALENKLRELSEKDSLTHLWNRRKFEQELQAQTQLVARYPDSHDACLVLIDIDFFKRINDEQGHDAGDRVIAQVADLLVSQLRTTDFISRIGGEEFAVIMPHTAIDEAQAVVERLRHAVDLDQSLTVTISAGITDLNQDSTRSYKCADIALYESKTLGRNRVSLCYSCDDIA
ncbi:diguanylate cyclase [Vibrio sp. ABG19]|uniref:sensor domain-containing diguanylate cyclase n=1 Tax=Vibrio sp. ABG19 TaxID=2817385 RepID=UPI00249EBD02|nr:diguanylate cyclase [Vibrio sp. ABG19]